MEPTPWSYHNLRWNHSSCCVLSKGSSPHAKPLSLMVAYYLSLWCTINCQLNRRSPLPPKEPRRLHGKGGTFNLWGFLRVFCESWQTVIGRKGQNVIFWLHPAVFPTSAAPCEKRDLQVMLALTLGKGRWQECYRSLLKMGILMWVQWRGHFLIL